MTEQSPSPSSGSHTTVQDHKSKIPWQKNLKTQTYVSNPKSRRDKCWMLTVAFLSFLFALLKAEETSFWCVWTTVRELLKLSSSCSSFSLGIEVHGSHWEPQAVLLWKPPGIEVIPRSWWPHCLPSSLFEQYEHVPVDAHCWLWSLVANNFPPCSRESRLSAAFFFLYRL